MACKVFWVTCEGWLFTDLAKKMHQEYNWYPIAWSATSNSREQVEKAFPGVQFFDVVDAVKGLYRLPNSQVSADGAFLERHAREMLLAIDQMDRMDPLNAFSFQERWDHFRSLVNFWQIKLKELSPDLVFFPLPPHLIYDYVIYFLCKANNIPIVNWLHTSMPGRIFIMGNYKTGCHSIKEAYKEKLDQLINDEPKLSPLVEKYYQNLCGEYELALPGYIAELNKKLSNIRSPKTVRSFLPNKAKLKSVVLKAKEYVELNKKPAPLNYIKQKGKSISASKINNKEFKAYKKQSNRRKLYLYKSYQELAEAPSFDENYIFFALHYQPEMTTNPLGGFFTDQLMAIEMLAANLPNGWKLYVKEAPLSFMPLYRLAYHRNRAYYNRIKELPGTKLISMEFSSFELIDHSQASATITSTAGWESVVRGKPCICFGYAWYRDCEGVYCIENVSGLQKLLSRLSNDELAVDPRKVRAYIAALDESAINGYVEMNKRADDQLTKDDNLNNLASALHSYYQKNYNR